jgi:hypothetical protein
MKIITSAARLAVVAALVTTGFVGLAASPALAAGCKTQYPNVTTFAAGACTGYGANFVVRASVKCNGTTKYGPWTSISGYSYVSCNPGQALTNGSYTVSP